MDVIYLWWLFVKQILLKIQAQIALNIWTKDIKPKSKVEMIIDTEYEREQTTSCTVPVLRATNLSFWEGPYFISLSLQENKMIYHVVYFQELFQM